MRFALIIMTAGLLASPQATLGQGGVVRYARFVVDGKTRVGIVEADRVVEIDGHLFGEHNRSDRSHKLADITLLPPSDASKVIAVGLNYRSHLGNRTASDYPPLFLKLPTSLIGHGAAIPMPHDAHNLHYEGEMVLVIGDTATHVSVEKAMDVVFGVTAGNDVSERDWQQNDLQWFRAKASDGFGPVGPFVATGLNPDDLLLTTRVNGEVRQQQRTSDLIFDVAMIVSYVSQYVTLLPGDLIFTGTPGTTQAMAPGDVVEIELEGVGTLRNVPSRGTTPATRPEGST